MLHISLKTFLVTALSVTCFSVSAQKSTAKKYPSLFWEITGNGLKKPSYLFGTMHVSSKMVFHLSDSFYQAIRSTDVVALELNPEQWQGDMFKMQKAQANIAKFASPERADLLNEKSFQLTKYEDNLKRALSEEPTVVNSLLYRSYQQRADFEENTYLDLYIYQTGRKLGKQPAGVEDYWKTEKLMLEAYQDMAKEKTKKTINTDGESMYDIERKMQEAYRKGDLDLMDSLDNITVTSPAFNEKFIYERNEIQAHSIDTILKSRSLFVGVGAAHLPGNRGVIEILRRKGYTLRPIFMQDRDAAQKDAVDKLRVPVVFNSMSTDDGVVTLQIPGELYKRDEARINESWQYADMNNGSYYMLTRVRNHAAMLGESEKDVLQKIDSMLYENIPGKILKKTAINKNGFSGFDITNRTRRGDIQRYNILVTPFEVLVFKMSGTDNYVEGNEAETFFNSIKLNVNTTAKTWVDYEPSQGGFSVKLPHSPNEVLNKKTEDRIDRWEYEAIDKKTGDAYFVWKKTVYNYNFLEEDSIDLSLIDESFLRSELVEKQISKKFGKHQGVPFADLKYALKNGDIVKARAYIKGPHYYLLAAKSDNKNASFNAFFDSFRFTEFRYRESKHFVDTFLNIDVSTASLPDIDTTLRAMMENSAAEMAKNGGDNFYVYWPRNKTAVFKSDSTGEAISVSFEAFPKYYYAESKEKFWNERLDEKRLRRGNDLVIYSKKYFTVDDAEGYRITLIDTNSSRQINYTYLLKDNSLFRFTTLTDTSNNQSDFITGFTSSFKPVNKTLGTTIFENKINLYFQDYYSPDSTLKKYAQKALSNVNFAKDGIDKVEQAINNLKYGDKDYFELKTKFISELGYITDTCCTAKVLHVLKDQYNKTSDTSYFQNAIFNSLARLKTKEAYTFLKQIIVQDPPLFENSYDYTRMFSSFSDTPKLAKTLFPEFFQLAQVEDYKVRINSLLKLMVDSGVVTANDYKDYFSKLYFDAKIQLKKQQARDEKIMEKENNEAENERDGNRNYNPSTRTLLTDYSVLLMPFYETNSTVPKYFEKLLQSKDQNVQLESLLLLVKNDKPFPDTLLTSLAAKDQFRARLLNGLTKMNKQHLFPSKFKNQELLAQSVLLNDRGYEKFAQIEMVAKKMVEVKQQKGFVYYFKYKIKKDDDWMMGISGLQPLNSKEVNATRDIVRLVDKKIKNDEPIIDQFDKQLKALIFSKYKSSRLFATSGNSRNFSNDYAAPPIDFN